MSDHLTGQRFEVSLDFDKPDRMVRIDFNALCRAEEISGHSFLGWEGELTGVRLKALMWASLVYEPGEKHLTYDEVGDVLNAKVFDVISALTEAWLKAMPEPKAQMEKTDGDPLKSTAAVS
jgi:hypothetical protein